MIGKGTTFSKTDMANNMPKVTKLDFAEQAKDQKELNKYLMQVYEAR